MTVRFLHTADVHLGSPLDGLAAEDGHLQDQLREATYDAFRRLIDVALETEVDLVVVAGDLYDRESRSVRANQFAAEQFARLEDAGIPVYLAYGNHDPVDAGIQYVDLPGNVHEFAAAEPESVVHESDGDAAVCLCGQSYRRKAESRRLHEGFEPADPDLPTIGVLHTGLDPDSERYVPCSRAELTDREAFDYWALGHAHRPQIHSRDPVVAYPGIPQGRHVNEAGLCGALLVELEADGTSALEFVPTGQIVWQEETVSIETADATDQVDPSQEAESSGGTASSGSGEAEPSPEVEDTGEREASGEAATSGEVASSGETESFGETEPNEEAESSDDVDAVEEAEPPGRAEPPSRVPELRTLLEDRLLELEAPSAPPAIDVPVRDVEWTPTGIMCRWVLTGRGPAHELLTSDDDVVAHLREELRGEYDRRSPFVWTEDVRAATGPPLPPLAELTDDPVFERFQRTVNEIHASDEIRDDLVGSTMGTVCEWDEGEEAEEPTRLLVDDTDLDRLIDRAAELVADELRTRRLG